MFSGSVELFGKTRWVKRGGWWGGSVDGAATVPSSPRAESLGGEEDLKKQNKTKLCKPQRLLLDDGVKAQGQLPHGDWSGLRRPAGPGCS